LILLLNVYDYEEEESRSFAHNYDDLFSKCYKLIMMMILIFNNYDFEKDFSFLIFEQHYHWSVDQLSFPAICIFINS
jgi:hypothetical protein